MDAHEAKSTSCAMTSAGDLRECESGFRLLFMLVYTDLCEMRNATPQMTTTCDGLHITTRRQCRLVRDSWRA